MLNIAQEVMKTAVQVSKLSRGICEDQEGKELFSFSLDDCFAEDFKDNWLLNSTISVSMCATPC